MSFEVLWILRVDILPNDCSECDVWGEWKLCECEDIRGFPMVGFRGKMLRNDCRHLALHTEWCVGKLCKSLVEMKLCFQSLKCSELELWWKGWASSTLFSVVVALWWRDCSWSDEMNRNGSRQIFLFKNFLPALVEDSRDVLEDRVEFEKSHIDVFIALGKISRNVNQSMLCRFYSFQILEHSIWFFVHVFRIFCEFWNKIAMWVVVDFKSHADVSQMD